jgi:prepilin-type N-terminal cleavage/methylation domain-containing protein/prepilin-type processing-associated H-X9-DG protein
MPACLRIAATARRRAAARPPQGFTLIELLVVVAVIGILAALLMPTLVRAIELGQRARCQSNLRQIGQAYMSYVRDNNGLVPRHNDHEPHVLPPPSGEGRWWEQSVGRLLRYMADPMVLRCPSDPGPFTELGKGRYFSYTSNTWVNCTKRCITDIKNPSTIIIFLDGSEGDGGTDGNDDRPYLPGGMTNRNYGFHRHSEGFNALFVDGHVQWYPIGETGPKNYQW